MQIQSIKGYYNNSTPNFGAIKTTNYLGGFAWDYTKSAKSVYDAFVSSKVLTKFCKENDVIVSFILNPVSDYHEAATLKIEKIFHNEQKGLLNKLLGLFKKKEEQIIYINAIEATYLKSKEKLAETISSIKYDADLKKFWQHPHDEFYEFKNKKPKWAEI